MLLHYETLVWSIICQGSDCTNNLFCLPPSDLAAQTQGQLWQGARLHHIVLSCHKESCEKALSYLPVPISNIRVTFIFKKVTLFIFERQKTLFQQTYRSLSNGKKLTRKSLGDRTTAQTSDKCRPCWNENQHSTSGTQELWNLSCEEDFQLSVLTATADHGFSKSSWKFLFSGLWYFTSCVTQVRFGNLKEEVHATCCRRGTRRWDFLPEPENLPHSLLFWAVYFGAQPAFARSCRILFVTLCCLCVKSSFCAKLTNIYSCHSILMSRDSLSLPAWGWLPHVLCSKPQWKVVTLRLDIFGEG